MTYVAMLSVKLFFGSICRGESGEALSQVQKINLGGRIYIIFPKQINITSAFSLRCRTHTAFCVLSFLLGLQNNPQHCPTFPKHARAHSPRQKLDLPTYLCYN
jgi:hypothetical protein